jgi:hypothetical protein
VTTSGSLRPQHEANYSPSTSATVMNAWSFSSVYPAYAYNNFIVATCSVFPVSVLKYALNSKDSSV